MLEHVTACHSVRISDVQHIVPRNQLLRDLPRPEWQLIAAHLRRVQMPRGLVLIEMDEQVSDAYFPESGCISGVVVTADGASIEGIIAGREDVMGPVFGLATSPWRLITIEPGEALVIGVGQLSLVLDETPELLRRLVDHASYVVPHAVAQSIACAHFHQLPDRLARWLLTATDLVDGDSIRVTHEQLAHLLGTYRPTVTLGAGSLEASGAIHQERGRIEVVDRARLEALSCECYGRLASHRRAARHRSPDTA